MPLPLSFARENKHFAENAQAFGHFSLAGVVKRIDVCVSRIIGIFRISLFMSVKVNRSSVATIGNDAKTLPALNRLSVFLGVVFVAMSAEKMGKLNAPLDTGASRSG